MASKKPASRKRATPPRACDHTRAFLKDSDAIIFVRAGTHSELFED